MMMELALVIVFIVGAVAVVVKERRQARHS